MIFLFVIEFSFGRCSGWLQNLLAAATTIFTAPLVTHLLSILAFKGSSMSCFYN